MSFRKEHIVQNRRINSFSGAMHKDLKCKRKSGAKDNARMIRASHVRQKRKAKSLCRYKETEISIAKCILLREHFFYSATEYPLPTPLFFRATSWDNFSSKLSYLIYTNSRLTLTRFLKITWLLRYVAKNEREKNFARKK